MKKYSQKGDIVTVPAPAAVVSGKLVVIGSLIGIAQKAAANAEPVPLVTEGVFEYAKAGSLAIAVGDKLYYVSANDHLNKTASGNTLVGIAVEAAATDATTVKVKLGATTV
jgi:predicted RecA/RadA family phage recombinase